MRKLLAVSIFFLVSYAITAQTYGNEWLNATQQYFKFPISKEGIYRIDSTTLSAYYNLTTTNPKNFQLFLKGKEQFLFIKGESDNLINAGDYLEFYASPLMGDVDSLIYTNIKYNPNPYIPIFNDTIYAFLTLNTSTSNKRFIQETDTVSTAYPPASYFYAQRTFSVRGSYNEVGEYDLETSDPRYTQAEGWGQNINKGTDLIASFSGLNTYTAINLPVYLSLNFSGMSKQNTSLPDHEVQTLYSNQSNTDLLLADTSFNGFTPVRQTFVLNNQVLNGNGTNVTIRSVAAPAFSAYSNNTLLHYINFFFPQRPDLNYTGFYKLFVDNSVSAPKSNFSFANFTYSNPNSVLFYDLTNGRRIPTVVANGKVKTLVPNSGGRKTCVIADESTVISVTGLRPVNQSGYFTDFKHLPAYKPYVIIYHSSLATSATAYKNYRQSAAGGSYNVFFADVDHLYEQFCYGVNKHPMAIKNFINYLKDSLATRPVYALLIGKAVECKNLNLVPSYEPINLVPTMGIPSSDNLLSANATYTNVSVFSPDVPIGRLATLTNSDVVNYLAKVQQHENTPTADWKKRVLHFVGGDDAELANSLAMFMDGYAQIIQDTLFGGEVYTFKKNTTAPIQLNISDSIKNIISNGAALLTFFGHGDQYGFDQAIDDPKIYTNAGKYPFVIANSCYSGNIHTAGDVSVSENFVLANQKGSIGFLAVTDYGFIHSLHNYTGEFYKSISATRYNKGIGDIIKEAAFENAIGSDILTQFASLDMTLHGDPALKISNGDLPDYSLKNNDIAFDIKTYSDSVGLSINFKNSGKAIRDSFVVKIQRYYANGDSATVYKNIKAPFFRDSLKLFMLIDFNRGIGLNKFTVKLDYFGKIVESDETNNATIGTLDVFIPGGDIVPVYPNKYAIVPKTNTITLKASTTDPFAPSTTYRFQLDTCDKFTSPIQTTVTTSKGGVLEWIVNLPLADSAVYFWRVSKDSTNPTTHFTWRESSFQTIGTKRGWAQAHFNQFKSDAYQFVNYNKDQRKFLFQNNKNSLSCRNGLYIGISINYFFNNINMANFGCAVDGWNFAVFDSISGEPQAVVANNYPSAGFGPYNNWVCVDNQMLKFYSFGPTPSGGPATPNWKQDMENFLNAIPPNNYVLAYTMYAADTNYASITTYNNALYTAFEHIGAVHIRTTKDTVPYILFGKKGMSAGQGHELVGTRKQEVIILKDSIQTRWHSGYIASEVIGPASKWNSMHWRVKSLDATAGDKTILKVLGIKNNGAIDTLRSFVQDSSDVFDLYNYANAQTYPYLKLVAFMSDDMYRTSPQLKRWQILYDEAPECAINPLKGFTSINDTLQEGDNVIFRFPIENISDTDFKDSLVVTYWIEDNNHNKTYLPQKLKAKPFRAGQLIIDTVTINSLQLKGNNALWIYVNPVQNARYQLEQTQFNNIGRYAFKVNADVTNPLLDVTFDGVRILNGDIVSAKPNILITLKDENKFLALNDTGSFTVFMQAPNQTTQQRIYFGQGLQFTPANLPKNSCNISYSPTLPVDGKYTLIVQARDRSKNNSGSSDYRIDFLIDNKPTVTNVLNYPNPFTTSTRFVFTLTGSEIPEVFTIRIMTITGKVVREITRSELGNLHIGRNITDYAWDARDTYGDRLAIGVYLYHVITKLNGSSIEKTNTSADKYFVKDFGKMVIMR